MAWTILPNRTRYTHRDSWGISVTKNGMTIYIPSGDEFLVSTTHVETQMGTGTDAGMVRLTPTGIGGRIIRRFNSRKIGAPSHIRFFKFPGIPQIFPLTKIEVERDVDGGVLIQLPWANTTTKPTPPPIVQPVRLEPHASSRATPFPPKNILASGVTVKKVMSPEQVAQFLRDAGRKASVKLSTDGKTYASGPIYILDGAEVSAQHFYAQANKLRIHAGMEQIATPTTTT